jgi:hypothetical protein
LWIGWQFDKRVVMDSTVPLSDANDDMQYTIGTQTASQKQQGASENDQLDEFGQFPIQVHFARIGRAVMVGILGSSQDAIREVVDVAVQFQKGAAVHVESLGGQACLGSPADRLEWFASLLKDALENVVEIRGDNRTFGQVGKNSNRALEHLHVL